MFSGCQKQVVVIFYFKFYKSLLYIAGLGIWMLGLWNQYVGTEPRTWINEEHTGRESWEDEWLITICSIYTKFATKPWELIPLLMYLVPAWYRLLRAITMILKIVLLTWTSLLFEKFTYLFAISMNDWNNEFFILKWRVKFLD